MTGFGSKLYIVCSATELITKERYDSKMKIWLIWSRLQRTKQCVQLPVVGIMINMQAQQRAGLWTQLTPPWLEGWGESAVSGLKQPNDLSVTCSIFPPMVCWSGHWCSTGQAQIQSDIPKQCDSVQLFP